MYAVLTICGALASGVAGCAHESFELSSPSTRARAGRPPAGKGARPTWTLRAIPSPAVVVAPQGALPAGRVSALIDRHVATGAGHYDLTARLRLGRAVRPIRVRYTATWGAPVPVDAPRRVTLRRAPLQGEGGESAVARVDLLGPGLGARGVQGHAILLRDEDGALLAALFEGSAAAAGGARRAPLTSRPTDPSRGRTGMDGTPGSMLEARVSDRVDYSEVSRGEDLCLVTREHRTVEVRVGDGPRRLVRVGDYLDLTLRTAAEPRAAVAPIGFRVVVLDASVVTARGASCGGEAGGRLSLVVVRRGAP